MNDDAFEWDETKAAKNYAAHGVSFEAARGVFKDPFAIEWLDEREPYGEDRFVIIGMVGGPPVVCRLYHERRGDPHYFGQRSRTL